MKRRKKTASIKLVELLKQPQLSLTYIFGARLMFIDDAAAAALFLLRSNKILHIQPNESFLTMHMAHLMQLQINTNPPMVTVFAVLYNGVHTNKDE